jgi:hypothetical protein
VPDESISKEKFMSTTPVSSSSIYQELQAYFQQRSGEVAQLGKDLSAGNLTNAQQDFTTLQSLGQGGPFANGDVFAPSNQREQDFTAIGQALQGGNLSAAQQAFAQLESTFKNGGSGSDPVPTATSTTISAPPAPPSAPPPPSQSIYQQLQEYRQQRKSDIAQLGQDLASGNTANALQDFNTLVSLGQNGPFKSGNTFSNNQREQDFTAIGKALQSGDVKGAQQAFAQLEATYQKAQTPPRTAHGGPVREVPTNAAPVSTLNTTA